MKSRFSLARTAVQGRGGSVFVLVVLASLSLAAQTNLPPPPDGPDPAPPHQTPVNLSPGMAEVVKLAQAGVTKDVLLAYVNGSTAAYHPTPDEIVYLNDLGVADEVIAALVKRPLQSADGANAVPSPSSAPVVTSPAPAPPPSPDPAPSPAPAPAPVAAPAQPLGPPATLMANPPPNYAPDMGPGPGSAGPPPEASTDDMVADDSGYFHDSLAPYGSWVNVPEFGLCWQPTVVVVNPVWRPYYDRGHWVYTDSGWFWQSTYSWGWAPFHYGRWLPDHRFGWVWSPGRVWAPSWVSWRYSGSYCGWAPLPPSARFEVGVGFSFHRGRVGLGFDFGIADNLYAFVPAGHFVDRDFHRYVAPAWQARGLYQSSSVMNNYRVAGKTVVNEGVGREWVAQAGRVNIPTVRLRDQSTASISVHAGINRSAPLSVYRPEPRAGSRPAVSGPPTAGHTVNYASAPRPSGPTAPAQIRYQNVVTRPGQPANNPATGGFGQRGNVGYQGVAQNRVGLPQNPGQSAPVPRPQTAAPRAPASVQYRSIPAYTPPERGPVAPARPAPAASASPAAPSAGYQPRPPIPAQSFQPAAAAPSRSQGGRAPGSRN